MDATVSELERLAALHQAGSLSDAEFEAQKARILGGSSGGSLRPPTPAISEPPVGLSETWRRRFAFFGQYGSPFAEPAARALLALPFRTQTSIRFNFWAFFFGPFYFLALGLPKRAASLTAGAVLIGYLVNKAGHPSLTNAVSVAYPVLFAMSVNYYRYIKVTQGRDEWNPLQDSYLHPGWPRGASTLSATLLPEPASSTQSAGSLAPRSTEFCPRCFQRLSMVDGSCPACDSGGPTEPTSLTVQGVSDRIADTLGLERIDGFDGRSFFSDLFSRRTPAEVEAHFAFGFPGHVPDPVSLRAEWPRPWAFLRVLAAGLACFLIFNVGYELFANSNLLPGLIVTGSFAAPLAMVVFFYEMNVPRNISIYHLVRLFMLGGVASLFLALLIGAVLPIDSLFGAPAAGVTEEAAKLAVVAVALRRMRLGPRPALLNAMLIGAAVGAGFAAFESAGYAFRVLLGELPGVTVVDVILLRGVLSPFGHVAWTAIAAAALWRVSDTGRVDGSRLTDPRFLKLFALAVVLHAAWDFDLPLPFGAKFVVLAVVAVVAVLSLLQQGVRAMGGSGEMQVHGNA